MLRFLYGKVRLHHCRRRVCRYVFAHQLLKSGKTFKLFSEGNKAASHISAGVCNPVVLKRYNKIWNDEAQMDYLPVIFNEIEKYLHKNYLIQENVVRVFHDEGEYKLWLKKHHRINLKAIWIQIYKNYPVWKILLE